MRQIKSFKALRIFIISFLTLMILLVPASCIPSDGASLLESLLENADGGKMTFVTKDGETVTVTITRETQAAEESDATKSEKEPEEKCTEDKKQSDSPELADILPKLNCIEDVFRTLGVWEKADVMRDRGLTWSHIAAELGYNKDNMYARLQEIIEERLHQARDLGLLEQEKLEYKFKYYDELALKWVNKIFTESDKVDSPDLEEILPKLNSIEDVFKTLGVWEDAAALREKGLTWSHIAEEFSYNEDSMYAHLQGIIEERLHQAGELGLITQEQFEYKFKYYSELALKWVNKIFAE